MPAAVDLIAGLLVVAAAGCGFWLGLGRSLPLAGFAAGAVLGSRAPLLFGQDLDSRYSLVAALPAALLLGALLAALLERFGWRMARRAGLGALADAGAGALLGACAGVAAVWLLAPVISEVPAARERLARSELVGRLNDVLAPAGPKRLEDRPIDVLPRFAGRTPWVGVGDESVLSDPDIVKAQRSVLKVDVTSCRGHGTGSGWVARNGIVVTNAHVVAGSSSIRVQARGGSAWMSAVPIWFDGTHDIALLRVREMRGLPALPMVRDAAGGASAAALGYPLGRWAVRRARIGPTTKRLVGFLSGPPSPGVSDTITGRLVTVFRSKVQPGSSGGPVVDTLGRVVTTTFAGDFASGSLGVPNRYVRAGLRKAGPRVGTASCRRR